MTERTWTQVKAERVNELEAQVERLTEALRLASRSNMDCYPTETVRKIDAALKQPRIPKEEKP